MSQVYEGELCCAQPQKYPNVRVTIKIYQTSWMQRDVFDFLEDKLYRRLPAVQSFKREHWAYERMVSIQGSVVPHVYGFFQVSAPTVRPLRLPALASLRRL